jgi:hypothetical protein
MMKMKKRMKQGIMEMVSYIVVIITLQLTEHSRGFHRRGTARRRSSTR